MSIATSGGSRRRRRPASREELRVALARVEAATDRAARFQRDPVSIVHTFADPADQELVAFLGASLAFGNVTTVLRKIREVLDRLGDRPSIVAEDERRVERALSGWVHRVYRGEDVSRLLAGARRVQSESGSLGARFASEYRAHGALRPALSGFVRAVRASGGFPLSGVGSRGASHLLPDPAGQSGCKRLLLFLRWMVRPADGVDLGLWSALLPANILLVPVDTHIHKLSRNLGLTARKAVTWEAAEEITARLLEVDPLDPVRHDFALCHLGMLQRCPSRRDVARCEGCGVKDICLHWR